VPKYLIKAKYIPGEGSKGLIADGGSARAKAVQQLIESVGGKMEAFYFAFGDIDAYTIMDVPDEASAAAIALTADATGLATTETVALLTPEDLDAAVKKSPMYDAPGPTA
jgi:uncharacterized protein with GYD domain